MATPPTGISAERLEVLRMVEARTISPDEGARLLESLDRAERLERQQAQATVARGPRNLRVQIREVGNRQSDIDIVLPLGLAEMGLKLAQRFMPGRLPDPTFIRETIESGYVGKLVDITDEGQHILIAIEQR
jgi:hypothetical protein